MPTTYLAGCLGSVQRSAPSSNNIDEAISTKFSLAGFLREWLIGGVAIFLTGLLSWCSVATLKVRRVMTRYTFGFSNQLSHVSFIVFKDVALEAL